MTIKKIHFNKLSAEGQQAFLAFIEQDQQQGHPASVLGQVDQNTSNAWFLWSGLSILFTIISTQIVSDKDRLAQEVAMTLGNPPPAQSTSTATMVLGILSLLLLLVGILKRLLEREVQPSWSPRIYFTDRLMIDANTEMLTLIPLSSVQSIELHRRNMGQSGTNIFYFPMLTLNDASKTTYRLESGQPLQLEQAVCDKVQALIQNPITDDVYSIGGISLLE